MYRLATDPGVPGSAGPSPILHGLASPSPRLTPSVALCGARPALSSPVRDLCSPAHPPSADALSPLRASALPCVVSSRCQVPCWQCSPSTSTTVNTVDAAPCCQASDHPLLSAGTSPAPIVNQDAPSVPCRAASPSFHPDSLSHPFAQYVEGQQRAPDQASVAAWRRASGRGALSTPSVRAIWQPPNCARETALPLPASIPLTRYD